MRPPAPERTLVERILAAARAGPVGDVAHVSAEIDHLRWFDLPATSVDS